MHDYESTYREARKTPEEENRELRKQVAKLQGELIEAERNASRLIKAWRFWETKASRTNFCPNCGESL